MQAPAKRTVRHDFFINPAHDGDAARLLLQRLDALAEAHASVEGEGSPVTAFAPRLRHMSAWLHDGCAFGHLMFCSGGGFTLDTFSDHPDHDNELFELTAEEAADFMEECRTSARPRRRPAPTLAQVCLTTLTTVDIAARWGCKRETVRYLIEGGHLPAFRVGQRHRIRREVVDKFERANSIRSMLANAAGDIGRTTFILNGVASRLRADARSAKAAAT